jgi:hypothetical protein
MHQRKTLLLACAGALGFAFLATHPASAAWPTGSLVNLPLCTATDYQFTPALVSDGAGGAIVVWTDQRSGGYDVYAQRVSAEGAALWATDGVVIGAATGDQQTARIVTDGAGGAIVAWEDYRSGGSDIYAQRISAGGAVQWTADGVALCSASGEQVFPSMVSDGAGGAIVTWHDSRGGSARVYAQRVSAAGAPQWTADGVALCAVVSTQYYPAIVADGSGGAIIVWEDHRTDYYGDLYAQRLSAGGTRRWTANGVAVCTSERAQAAATMVSDGAGGAIVAWQDRRPVSHDDVYAQHLQSGGVVDPSWPADGRALCTAAATQSFPMVVSDLAGGAIVAWEDERNGAADLYTQRVLAGGETQWTADGEVVCVATGMQWGVSIAPDGVGGAIVSWYDYRSGNYDIYAQRFSPAGAAQWTANGVVLCTAGGHQAFPNAVPDGTGGAIFAWQDGRGGVYDIYAQRVDGAGVLGGTVLVGVPGEPALAFALEPVRPNPLRDGALSVRFTLASGGAARLELSDVAGRRIAAREVGSLGAGRHTVDLGRDARLAPGLYLVSLRQGGVSRVTRVAVLR